MAEFVMKDEVCKHHLEDQFFITSKATSREEIGNDMYPPAKRKLQEKGVPFTTHCALQITPDDYDAYDYIIGMDDENMYNLMYAYHNDPQHKIFLLLDFANRHEAIADPWYTNDFETTYNDVLEGVQALLAYIQKHDL